jgi:uncharacterized YccA/Bax inhibitor family protein
VLGENTFLDVGSGQVVSGGRIDHDEPQRHGQQDRLLLLLALAGAAFTWTRFTAAAVGGGDPAVGRVGAIGGLIVALITVFKKTWAPVTRPLYALLEGLFLGGISALMEVRFPGIVMQAVGLTFGTLFALLVAYRSG